MFEGKKLKSVTSRINSTYKNQKKYGGGRNFSYSFILLQTHVNRTVFLNMIIMIIARVMPRINNSIAMECLYKIFQVCFLLVSSITFL